MANSQDTAAARVRVAVVGAGVMGGRHAASAAAAPGVTVVRITPREAAYGLRLAQQAKASAEAAEPGRRMVI